MDPSPESPERASHNSQSATGWKVSFFVILLLFVLSAVVNYLFWMREDFRRAEHAYVREAVAKIIRDQHQPKNVTFSATSCLKDWPFHGPKPGVLNQEWKSETTLKIVARAVEPCGSWIVAGKYVIDGNNLVLQYLRGPTGSEAACLCEAEVAYEIADLERKPYEFKLEHFPTPW